MASESIGRAIEFTDDPLLIVRLSVLRRTLAEEMAIVIVSEHEAQRSEIALTSTDTTRGGTDR